MCLTKTTLWQIHFAAHVLRMGGVIAQPTEAVWGLTCDPFNPRAVERLLAIKQRPVEKGLILVSGQAAHFHSLLSPLSESLSARFFQQNAYPTTWLVPDEQDLVPAYIKGQHASVALRLTDYAVLAELSRIFGGPLVSSSANPAGRAPANSLFRVNQYFKGKIDFVLPAALGKYSAPSEIRDLVTNDVLRA